MTTREPDQAALDEHRAMQAWLAGVPRPADAGENLQPWLDLDNDGTHTRTYSKFNAMVPHNFGRAKIETLRTQHSDGQVERIVLLDVMPCELSADQARALAAALLDAAGRTDLA